MNEPYTVDEYGHQEAANLATHRAMMRLPRGVYAEHGTHLVYDAVVETGMFIDGRFVVLDEYRRISVEAYVASVQRHVEFLIDEVGDPDGT